MPESIDRLGGPQGRARRRWGSDGEAWL